MASLGFAACLQEILSDHRARYLLNFLTTFFTLQHRSSFVLPSIILRSELDHPP